MYSAVHLTPFTPYGPTNFSRTWSEVIRLSLRDEPTSIPRLMCFGSPVFQQTVENLNPAFSIIYQLLARKPVIENYRHQAPDAECATTGVIGAVSDRGTMLTTSEKQVGCKRNGGVTGGGRGRERRGEEGAFLEIDG